LASHIGKGKKTVDSSGVVSEIDVGTTIKTCPHQQQRRSNIVEATSNFVAFDLLPIA